MSTLLKDLYNPEFYDRFSRVVKKVHPSFKPKEFQRQIFSKGFTEMELKERMRHTTKTLHSFLPERFSESAAVIDKIRQQLVKDSFAVSSIEFMFLPDYIEVYGLEHYDESVQMMEKLTTFITCEFAVRPFMNKYGNSMFSQMLKWSDHRHHQVRRLSTEGMRPRLPWALAVPVLKKDPSPVLPILEKLKSDPSETVRRSVANNLNDISKDHPSVVLSVIKRWKGLSPETDALIKHASRTLLKAGHSEILRFFDLHDTQTELTAFSIQNPRIKTGDRLGFRFSFRLKDKKPRHIRLEYYIHYLLKNGTHYKKVFKISEKLVSPDTEIIVEKEHSFRPITTRTYYLGEHMLSVAVNGRELARKSFRLLR